MINQLSLFLQNEQGRLAAASRALTEAEINMHAMVLADTQDFGVVRIICDFPEKAASILAGAGYRASVTPVIGVKVPNRPGDLASLLEYCDQCGLNIEYGYCYSVNGEYALEVLKVDSPEAEATLGDGGFETVSADEVYDY